MCLKLEGVGAGFARPASARRQTVGPLEPVGQVCETKVQAGRASATSDVTVEDVLIASIKTKCEPILGYQSSGCLPVRFDSAYGEKTGKDTVLCA